MTPQQKTLIDEAARGLVMRLRKDNEAVARNGGQRLNDDEYTALEQELREVLSRRAARNRDSEPVGT
jgi:hypothetical protein